MAKQPKPKKKPQPKRIDIKPETAADVKKAHQRGYHNDSSYQFNKGDLTKKPTSVVPRFSLQSQSDRDATVDKVWGLHQKSNQGKAKKKSK
jgi:hypothetical protein